MLIEYLGLFSPYTLSCSSVTPKPAVSSPLPIGPFEAYQNLLYLQISSPDLRSHLLPHPRSGPDTDSCLPLVGWFISEPLPPQPLLSCVVYSGSIEGVSFLSVCSGRSLLSLFFPLQPSFGKDTVHLPGPKRSVISGPSRRSSAAPARIPQMMDRGLNEFGKGHDMAVPHKRGSRGGIPRDSASCRKGHLGSLPPLNLKGEGEGEVRWGISCKRGSNQ